jgi:hypothetical protein
MGGVMPLDQYTPIRRLAFPGSVLLISAALDFPAFAVFFVQENVG